MYKTDSVDEKGQKMWVLSVQTDWTQQNLKLINNVLKSGMWYMELNDKDEIVSAFLVMNLEKMLGYHDILDFPNRYEMLVETIHPDDRDRVVSLLNKVIRMRKKLLKFNSDCRMRMSDKTYQWFRFNAEIIRRRDGSPLRMVGTFINIEEQRANELFIKK